MKNADTIIVKSVIVLVYSTLSILLLSFALALFLPLVMDSSYYEARIVDMVLEKTGRKMTLDGEIQMDLFPDLAITLERVSLSNAPGFSSTPMIKIRHLHGNLRLMQLWTDPFVLDHLFATGVQIILERDATGKNNWDDLVARTATDIGVDFLVKSEASSVKHLTPKISLAQLGAISLAALSARGITLKESEIRLCEQAAKTQIVSCLAATHLEVLPGQTGPDRALKVTLKTDLTVPHPPFSGRVMLATYYRPPQENEHITRWQDTQVMVRGHIDMPPVKEFEMIWHSDISVGPEPNLVRVKQADSKLIAWSDTPLFRELVLSVKGPLEADLSSGKFRLPQGGLAWQVKADYLPPAGVKLAFLSAIEADWQQETLWMEPFRATGPAQIRLEGQLRGSHLLSRPRVDAKLTAFRFDPRALLVALGRSVPPTTDPKAISSAELSADIHLSDQETSVTNMALEVDDSHFSGHFRVRHDPASGLPEPVIRFDLQGDRLELDRYLPPNLTRREKTGEIVSALVAPEIFLPWVPAHLLRDKDLQGVLRLRRLRVLPHQAISSQATNLSLDISVNDGRLQLKPRLTMYGGSLDTHVHLDARGEEPLVTVDKTITGIRVESLLQDITRTTQTERMGWAGSADLVAHLSSRGRQPDILRENLNGTLELVVNNGRIQGMNLVDRIRESYFAVMERRPLVLSGDKKGVTRFSKLTATGVVTHGVLENKDLLAVSPTLRVSGEGQVDLSRTSVDYLLEASVATSLQGVSVHHRDNIQGLVLPIRIQGDFKTLKVPSSLSTVDFSRLLRSVVATPRMKKAVNALGWKGKLLEKIDKFEKKLDGKDNANDILKKLLGVGN